MWNKTQEHFRYPFLASSLLDFSSHDFCLQPTLQDSPISANWDVCWIYSLLHIDSSFDPFITLLWKTHIHVPSHLSSFLQVFPEMEPPPRSLLEVGLNSSSCPLFPTNTWKVIAGGSKAIHHHGFLRAHGCRLAGLPDFRNVALGGQSLFNWLCRLIAQGQATWMLNKCDQMMTYSLCPSQEQKPWTLKSVCPRLWDSLILSLLWDWFATFAFMYTLTYT